MSDRFRTLTVILDFDYKKEESLVLIMDAIKMIKGVMNVDIGQPIDMTDYAARLIVKRELQEKIWEVLK